MSSDFSFVMGRSALPRAFSHPTRRTTSRYQRSATSSIVMDGRAPLCVIRTTNVEVRPFGLVDEAFAWVEGKGTGVSRPGAMRMSVSSRVWGSRSARTRWSSWTRSSCLGAQMIVTMSVAGG